MSLSDYVQSYRNNKMTRLSGILIIYFVFKLIVVRFFIYMAIFIFHVVFIFIVRVLRI